MASWQGDTMGSIYTVKLVDPPRAPSALEALKTELDHRLVEVNRQMSHYVPESELSRFNRWPAGRPFPVSSNFAWMVRLTLDLNRRSQGAFDPTLGPVINLWGFGEKSGARHVPGEEELKAALAQTGCRHLTVTARDELVKDIGSLHLNLSAIAKGFGADEMASALRAHGATNFYVAISGETVTSGRNAKGEPWRVGVSAPVFEWAPGDPLVAIVPLSGRAICTSGDYQKYFVDAAGHRWSHLFDPRTGRSVQNRVGSVSVVAESGTLADALATTLFVLGEERGLKLIEEYPDTAALFVMRNDDGTFRLVRSSRFPAFVAGP